MLGLADRHAADFGGLSSEFRWQVFEHASSPVALTLSFAPQWRRIDAPSGQGTQNYTLPVEILADMALIPNKVFAGVNLTYAPTFTRGNGAWQQAHPLEISAALSAAITEKVFFGGEIRHLAGNQNGFLTGHGLFVGPSLHVKLSETLSFKVVWSAQIPDETSGRLDLVNYERHQVLAQFVMGF